MMLMIPEGYETAQPDDGARISFAGGKAKIAHGPFRETKEALGGYWMIRVKSKDEAISWASRVPVNDGSIVEVRQVFEMEEFPEDVRAAAGDFPERMKEAQR